jgi:hypothetical protein
MAAGDQNLPTRWAVSPGWGWQMALKWVGALSTATALGAFAMANLVPGYTVPVVANLVLVVGAMTGVVLVVVAELYRRLDSRLSAMSDFLVARLGEIVTRLDEQEATAAQRGLADLLAGAEATVVPIGPRRSGR